MYIFSRTSFPQTVLEQYGLTRSGTLERAVSICNDSTVRVREDSVEFANTPLRLTIPKDVGPSADNYAIHAQLFQTNGEKYGAEISSDSFQLTSAIGAWNKIQLAGVSIWTEDAFPCESYGCVSECVNSTIKGSFSLDLPSSDDNHAAYLGCLSHCKGVDMAYLGLNETMSGAYTPKGAELPPQKACGVSPTASVTSDYKIPSASPTPTAEGRKGCRHCGPSADASSNGISRSQQAWSAVLTVSAVWVAIAYM
jgi:hypothetical protein